MKVKKLFALLLLLPVCATSPGQQKLESFYGLKLGGKYGQRAVVNALLASGADKKTARIIKDTLPSLGRLSYTLDGLMVTMAEDIAPVRSSATVIMAPDSTFEALILTPESKYFGPLAFVADEANADVAHYANANVGAVNDDFFGLKLGGDVGLMSLIKSVGENGVYISSHNEGKTRVHCFKDVKFADFQWDYALFSLTPSGKFVAFTVYSVFEGAMKGYHPANRLHIQMRNHYFKQYGYPVPSGEEDEILNDYVFTGQNGIDQVISFFDTETDRGKSAYCVQMEFVNDALNRTL